MWGNVGICGGKLITLKPEDEKGRYAMRFIGNIEAKVDSKGRAFLPAVFRRELQQCGEELLVLRKDVYQDCLVLYPESVWNAQMDLLRSRLNRFDRAEQLVFRQFVSDAELLPVDSNGRILIPRRYMAMSSIERDVKFVGMGDTIEIWSMANADKPFMEAEQFAAALQQLMQTPDSSDTAQRR